MVCNDSETAQLCTHATRRQDYREEGTPLVREKGNRLRRVDRRTAAKHNHMVRFELNKAHRPHDDGLDIWIRLQVGKMSSHTPRPSHPDNR
mgnify:CR=1 FL=1